MTFVTQSGSSLKLGATTLHLVGCNIYWLGKAEGPVAYPTFAMQNDALVTAKEMGATLVRAHTLGISTGNAYGDGLGLWSTIGVTNPSAWATMDYGIYRAGQLGILLIIPLTDNWRYSAGGKHDFTEYRGLTTTASLSVDEGVFYTDANCIADFKAYLSVYLNRLNPYNGLHYYEDPTIMCWETGNELQGPIPTTAWNTAITTHIRGIDPNHLIMDGSGSGVYPANYSTFDIMTNHFYPPSVSTVNSNATSVTGASKPYIVGEYGWSGYVGGTAVMSVDSSNPHTGTQSLKIVVPTAATFDFYDQVQQHNVSLTATHNYTLTFWAMASVGYTMSALIQASSALAFQTYKTQNYTLTTSWAQYTMLLNGQPSTDTTAMIEFNLGLGTATTWIDDVSLTDNANSSVNLALNPGFESGTTSWNINNKSIDSLDAFLANFEAHPTTVAANLWWVLMPHSDLTGFHQHGGDTYSMYYPGQTADMLTRSQKLRTHAYAMQGISPAPAAMILTQAPMITKINTGQIGWSGIAGAATYVLQTAIFRDGPWTTLSTIETDFTTPYLRAGKDYTWYRVAGVNLDGVQGPYSEPRKIDRVVDAKISKFDGVHSASKDGMVK